MTDVSNKLKVNSNKSTEITLTGLRGEKRVVLLILSRDITTERDFLVTPLDIIIIMTLRALKAFEILIDVSLVALKTLERVDTAIINI